MITVYYVCQLLYTENKVQITCKIDFALSKERVNSEMVGSVHRAAESPEIPRVPQAT